MTSRGRRNRMNGGTKAGNTYPRLGNRIPVHEPVGPPDWSTFSWDSCVLVRWSMLFHPLPGVKCQEFSSSRPTNPPRMFHIEEKKILARESPSRILLPIAHPSIHADRHPKLASSSSDEERSPRQRRVRPRTITLKTRG